MSLSAPSAPDPVATANAQTQTNEATAAYQARINDVNQVNPYGSLTYSQSGTDPATGAPIYTSTENLNQPEQNLFNTYVNTQQGLGNAANSLIGNLGSSLTQAPNLSNSALTSNMMNWFNQYESPIWNQQQSNLQSQLAAEGAPQGGDDYMNAMNLQSRNVGDATNQFLMEAEPSAFNQALQSYEAPIQTLGTLLGLSSPGNINSNLTQTPSETIQPANITGDTYSSYDDNLKNYQDTMNGMFGLGSAALGGITRAIPFSDVLVKENIQKVGTLPNGLSIYQYNLIYDKDGIPQVGLLAQEVELYNPLAIRVIDGIKHVDYEKAVNGDGPNTILNDRDNSI